MYQLIIHTQSMKVWRSYNTSVINGRQLCGKSQKRNKIRGRSITCSHISHLDISKVCGLIRHTPPPEATSNLTTVSVRFKRVLCITNPFFGQISHLDDNWVI